MAFVQNSGEDGHDLGVSLKIRNYKKKSGSSTFFMLSILASCIFSTIKNVNKKKRINKMAQIHVIYNVISHNQRNFANLCKRDKHTTTESDRC